MAARSTVEKQWTAHGLECAVLRIDARWTDAGFHRTGYCRISDDHPWFGLNYSDEVPGSPADLDDRSMDDAGMAGMVAAVCGTGEQYACTVEGHIAVHGGLTFAAETPSDDLPKGWWFGFDCAHSGDTPDFWTLDAVRCQVEKMAEQVAAHGMKAAA